MRHRKDHRKLSRTASHRKALLRNLVTALFQYERIETTVAKAKEARRMAERLITFGKQGDVAARRHVSRFVMRPAVVQKLFSTIAPWYAERQGGYTRIIRIGRRLGDAGEIAYLELMKTPEQREKERQDRLAAAEAREAALRGSEEKKKAKNKSEATVEADAEEKEKEKPRRGGKKDGGSAAPARKRTRTGVKTG